MIRLHIQVQCQEENPRNVSSTQLCSALAVVIQRHWVVYGHVLPRMPKHAGLTTLKWELRNQDFVNVTK